MKKQTASIKSFLTMDALNNLIYKDGYKLLLGEVEKDQMFIAAYLVYHKDKLLFHAPSIMGVLKLMEMNLGKFFMEEHNLYIYV